jgi:hypothetical protein
MRVDFLTQDRPSTWQQDKTDIPSCLFDSSLPTEHWRDPREYRAHFQLRLDEEAQELLAIRTPDALYYPLMLPFGPASGPAQFQQRTPVSEVLGDLYY